ENRTNLLEGARRNLSDARANQASARNVSLISRIDTPDTGPYPVGPSRTVISLAGLAGGIVLGFGLVFLTVDVQPSRSQAFVQSHAANESTAAHAVQSNATNGTAGSSVPNSPQTVEFANGSRTAADLSRPAVTDF